MKLDPAVFWSLSLREWILTQRGFLLDKEKQMQQNWEIARWQAYVSILPYKSKNSILTPKSLITFPWEQADEIETFTDEEEDYFMRKWGKFVTPDNKFTN